MIQVVADGSNIHGKTLQRVEDARRRLGRDYCGLGGVVEYFKDAVDRVCHMEPMGEVVVDHVAVALLNRCNISGFCWIL